MKKVKYMFLAVCLIGCSKSKKENVSLNELNLGFQKLEVRDTTSRYYPTVDGLKICYGTYQDYISKGIQLMEFNNTDFEKEIERISLYLTYDESLRKIYKEKDREKYYVSYNKTEIINEIWLLNNNESLQIEAIEIHMSKMPIREVENLFPKLKWGISGDSKCWVLGNDTINFYVLVDTAIQRFPINHDFYSNMNFDFLKIKQSCHEIYGRQLGIGDTISQKPLYAPWNENHMNYYIDRRKKGIETTLTEISSAGKRSINEKLKIGKWQNYLPNHRLKSTKYYENGKLIME